MTIAGRHVESWYDYGPRKGPVQAIVTHFTEGGGGWPDVYYCASAKARIAAGYPAGDGPSRGVSIQYMILGAAAGKDDGLIVSMVPESHASGSINPRELRTTNDAAFTSPDGARVVYGVTARKAAMGSWDHDPNSAIIGIELAGKAAKGPTPKQTASLARLYADIRTRHPKAHALGHRDFTSTKPCPGHLVHWASLRGHGAPGAMPEEDQMGLNVKLAATAGSDPLPAFGTARIKGTGHDVFRISDARPTLDLPDGMDLGTVQRGTILEPMPGWAKGRPECVVFNLAGESTVALLVDVTFTPLPAPPAPEAPAPIPHTVELLVDGASKAKVTL